ncbi:MAG: hypothetical protein NPINA01_06500 [Nitrospinaceae bacterium]|nr:MAG: hypothetical protein NPINA01_06500 [Nitrospinaceae bacterium]
MNDFTLKEFEDALENKLKPLCKEVRDIKKTMFGEDGRGGITADVAKAHDLAVDHEVILRGRDKASGLIHKINYLWGVAFTGAAGLFWKAYDWFSNN